MSAAIASAASSEHVAPQDDSGFPSDDVGVFAMDKPQYMTHDIMYSSWDSSNATEASPDTFDPGTVTYLLASSLFWLDWYRNHYHCTTENHCLINAPGHNIPLEHLAVLRVSVFLPNLRIVCPTNNFG